MAKVDFYLISQSENQERMFFACRLCEKAMSQSLKIYIHTESEQAAQEMDDLLWSYKPESFIPHAIVGLDEEIDADEDIPVFIGFTEQCDTSADLLINLGRDIPSFHDQFKRIAEIVSSAEDAKQKSREHWNTYKDKAFELAHHQL